MEQQIREILNKIDALEKVINVIQQNLNSNIQSFLACLALVVATSGVALVYYVKSTVNKRVEKELAIIKENLKNELQVELTKKIRTNLKNELMEEVKNRLEVELKDYIKKNQQFKWATGTTPVSDNNDVFISGLAMSEKSAKELPIKLDVFTVSGDKEIQYDYQLSQESLYLKLKNFNRLTDGFNIKWKIVWINDELYD